MIIIVKYYVHYWPCSSVYDAWVVTWPLSFFAFVHQCEWSTILS